MAKHVNSANHSLGNGTARCETQYYGASLQANNSICKSQCQCIPSCHNHHKTTLHVGSKREDAVGRSKRYKNVRTARFRLPTAESSSLTSSLIDH